MKKAAINLSFDEEKLSAIRMYMTKKDADLDAELLSQLDRLYEKYVPTNVRDFITERYGEDDTAVTKNVTATQNKSNAQCTPK
ncbi:MAG: DUF6103 family protein [Eubacteriales bacterium]|nr:DUF6103 family protein [Eubacteriales bacterium]